MSDTQENVELLTIRFGITSHAVNAEAVAAMIRAVTRLIHKANREVCSQCELNVKVRAFEAGSLEIPLDIIIPTGIVLLESAPIISATINICKEFLSLKKWLQGKPLPDKEMNRFLETGEPKITLNAATINIYNQCGDVHNDFSEAFHETKKDPSVKDITLFKGIEKEEIVKIPDTHFQSFEEIPQELLPPTNFKEKSERTEVTIHTPVLEGKGKWKVVYQKRIISVSIKDDTFSQNVAGTIYRFGSGDKLDVSISIRSKIDPLTEEDIIDPNGYTITKVWKTIPKQSKSNSVNNLPKKPQQKTFFDSEQ
jgi:hypothetical protein